MNTNHILEPSDGQSGFTLVEMMIVVAVIGLLAALAVPGFAKARKTALAQKCIANQRIVFQAVQRYEMDYNTTLRSVQGDGAAIRDKLLNASYVSDRGAFECPASQTKDYDDILLSYNGNDFVNTTCSILPTEHVLE